MSADERIQPSLQLQFKTEQISRTIKECNDINLLKEIAMELLKLNLTKTAVADWATKRALQADTAKLHKKND